MTASAASASAAAPASLPAGAPAPAVHASSADTPVVMRSSGAPEPVISEAVRRRARNERISAVLAPVLGAVADRGADFGEPRFQRSLARRKRRGDRGDAHCRVAAERAARVADHRGVNADGGDLRPGGIVGGTERFLAKRRDFAARVFALQRGEIDHRDGGPQPPKFRGLLNRSGGVFRHALLDAHGIHGADVVEQRGVGVRHGVEYGWLPRGGTNEKSWGDRFTRRLGVRHRKR